MEAQELTIEQKLAAPMEFQWRVKTFYKDGVDKKELKAGSLPAGTKGQFLAYIDARDVFDRLDNVYGANGWRDSWDLIDAQRNAIREVIEVWDGDQWVSKSDVGYPNSEKDEEPLKSAVSDGVKRAGVQLGIGRFLYSLEPIWVEVDKWGKPLKPISGQVTVDKPVAAKVPAKAPSAPEKPFDELPETPTPTGEDVMCEYPDCDQIQTSDFAEKCKAKHGKVYCQKHWGMANKNELNEEVPEPEKPSSIPGGDYDFIDKNEADNGQQ